jgi:hypothetical protein
MRKFLPLILVLFIVTISSCTKEYICQCVVKYSGNPPALPDSTIFEFNIKDKKDEAAKKCEANSATLTQDNITMDEKCRLY